MAEYSPAPEVAKIVTDLIGSVHDHGPLAAARIDCVFRNRAQKRRGKVTLGKARRVSGLPAYLANDGQDFFVLEIALDTWGRLDEQQQRALVDHELCHLQVNDPDGMDLAIRDHDIEEFAGVVQRHGLWASDVARFGSTVAEQLALAVEEVSTFVEGLDNNNENPDD